LQEMAQIAATAIEQDQQIVTGHLSGI
jgi:hypothetical protein